MSEDTKVRTRNETTCRNTKSKDGTLSTRLGVSTASRATRYCNLTNKNRTKFIEECVNAQLDILEEEYYQSLSKEDLIELVRKGK